ncbi:hypothetical protein O6H91_23G000700 [Diphasiastrum complanatum]|uniref:Uncharacterized protein n=1 Tax=Diphasiastrum complanatum TaxID=34168 RepID=A0ACC2A7D5_DIPCM|nr:hypothetical protein O6H91_23G000700 [Diphasiastrum complanatum]
MAVSMPSIYLVFTILFWCHERTHLMASREENNIASSSFNILKESHAIREILAYETVARLDHLGKVSDAENYLERTFLSPAALKAGKLIQDWMIDAGLNTADGLMKLGTYMDTVIGAGKYDGALGIVTAIAAVKSLNKKGKLFRFPRPIEIIAFSDEEGIRFQSTFLGSAAIAGTLSTQLLSVRDKSGTTLRDSLHQASLKGSEESLLHLKYDKFAVWGYIEVHIEQGPVLEFKKIPLGVVEAIAGQTRLKVTLQGLQGHAGTVPMLMRKDPMPAAAKAILHIEELCTKRGDDNEKASSHIDSTAQLVCTVGEISSWPGASNVIPGQVVFTVDIRSRDDYLREETVLKIESNIHNVARARALSYNIERKHEAKAVKCDSELTHRLKAAAKSGISKFLDSEVSDIPLLTSGAGHDAMAMARLTKVGMIFVRCTGGISHSPAEHVLEDDIGAASSALLSFLEHELDLLDS